MPRDEETSAPSLSRNRISVPNRFLSSTGEVSVAVDTRIAVTTLTTSIGTGKQRWMAPFAHGVGQPAAAIGSREVIDCLMPSPMSFLPK